VSPKLTRLLAALLPPRQKARPGGACFSLYCTRLRKPEHTQRKRKGCQSGHSRGNEYIENKLSLSLDYPHAVQCGVSFWSWSSLAGESVPLKFSPPPAWQPIFILQSQVWNRPTDNLNDLQLKLQNGICWKQLSMKAECFSGFLGVICALAVTDKESSSLSDPRHPLIALDASRGVRSSLTIPSCYSMSRIPRAPAPAFPLYAFGWSICPKNHASWAPVCGFFST
jgi:hypothetical protein